MIKDILIERVEDVAVAVIPEEDEKGIEEWNVYLLNLKENPIDGVLISSNGYGSLDGKNMKTNTLRHFFEKISAQDYVKIEWIDKRLFGITNEFWVSFWYHGTLFDKRYVFVTESIVENNFTEIPMIGKRGVMIK
ncbi:MAG: hypothetical protein ABIO46_01625 [Chitinophagales bacterium]